MSESPRAEASGIRSAFSEDALRRGQGSQMAFVRATCWLFVIAPLVTGTVHVLRGHADRLPGLAPFWVLGLVGLWLLARGRMRTAFGVLAYGGWLCTLNIALWTGGLSAPALSALPVVIALAGWLAGPRTSLVLMAASAPYLVVLAAAARGGWGWPAFANSYDPFHIALVYGFSTVGAGLLGYFAARSNDGYIASLEESERALAFQVSLHEFTERIARVGHWTSSRSRDTLQWSDSFFDLCGAERRSPMPVDGYRNLIRIVDQEAFDAARDRLDGTPAVYRITLSDGTPRWFRASLHRPPGAGLGNDECLGVAQDITGEHEAKLALERLNAELEQRVAARTGELRSANDELDTFAYSVAHDLTAPLRAINGFAALLETDWGPRLDDEGRSHLGRIRQASSRMASLIEDLLRLSHVTRTNLDRRPIDLSGLAREVAAELSAADPQRQVAWRIEEGLVANADRGLARVLLANLLGNAWKYTRDSAHPEIRFERAAGEGEPDEFRVRDNGVGFDMAHAAQLFAPFRRLHGPQEFEGNGIGLATVHRIVRRHGGQVRARGEPGRGASFCFTLPPAPAT